MVLKGLMGALLAASGGPVRRIVVLVLPAGPPG
jgi:hypothetical protein